MRRTQGFANVSNRVLILHSNCTKIQNLRHLSSQWQS